MGPNNPAESSPSIDHDVRESAENTDHNNQQQNEPASASSSDPNQEP
jgi:hypothetical protein